MNTLYKICFSQARVKKLDQKIHLSLEIFFIKKLLVYREFIMFIQGDLNKKEIQPNLCNIFYDDELE